MIDESSGLPYYYHTKTGETVWEKPEAFVIPLAVLQVSYLPSFIVSISFGRHAAKISANVKKHGITATLLHSFKVE